MRMQLINREKKEEGFIIAIILLYIKYDINYLIIFKKLLNLWFIKK